MTSTSSRMAVERPSNLKRGFHKQRNATQRNVTQRKSLFIALRCPVPGSQIATSWSRAHYAAPLLSKHIGNVTGRGIESYTRTERSWGHGGCRFPGRQFTGGVCPLPTASLPAAWPCSDYLRNCWNIKRSRRRSRMTLLLLQHSFR